MLAPPDVCWFKVLKSLYIKDWNDWFQFGEKTFTKSHNLRGPGYVLMCQWIEKAWMELKADYIIESFKYCGITTSVIAQYHSSLIKLLTDAELPLNSSVEERNEEDEHTDIFLNHDAFADEEPASETNSLTDGSTESVSASEQSTSDTSTSESSQTTTPTTTPTTTSTTASTSIKASTKLPSTKTPSTTAPSTTAPSTTTQSTPVLKAISNITVIRKEKPKALSTSTPRVKSTSLSALDQSQRAINIENLLLPPKPVPPPPATPPAKEKQPKKAQKSPAAAKNTAASKTQKSPAAPKNAAASTITAAVICPAGVCAKCGDKTNYRVCDAIGCSKKTCLNCFGTKVTPSTVHFCSRSCQRK